MPSLPYHVSISVEKEDMKFSAAHFTIFADGTRERIHGHNFRVRATVEVGVEDHGLAFDYGIIKKLLRSHCAELDEYLLLPQDSAFLQIDRDQETIEVRIGGDVMRFPKADVIVLPVENITGDALSKLFAERLSSDLLKRHGVRPARITCGISSGAGQWVDFTLLG